MKTINKNNDVVKLVDILRDIKNGSIKTKCNNLKFTKK